MSSLLDLFVPREKKFFEKINIEMLKHLRQDAWGKNAQVILLTNLSTSEKSKEATDAGVIEYLVKTDWTLADIAKKVKVRLGAM
ncbi:MAG: hypothetical protein Q7S61_03345 [bacterium]|nr:hypothetical protein [bacterium]